MKKGLSTIILLCFFVTACGQTISPSPVPSTQIPTVSPVASPSASPSLIPSIPPTLPLPTETSTATQEAGCDALVNYCIASTFRFFRPYDPPLDDGQYNDLIDPIYTYGSTLNGTREPHHGVEFKNPSGTPVRAVWVGTVVYAGNDQKNIFSLWPNFYGNLVILEHTGGTLPYNTLYTLYAHLSKIDVIAGQIVKSGDKIGEVGMTGSASGYHLHFEIRTNQSDYSSTLNPVLFIAPKQDNPGGYRGVLAMRFMDLNHDWVYAEPTVEYYPRRNAPAATIYHTQTYAEGMLPSIVYRENATVSDLIPGDYRVSVVHAGILYERWVKVESGRITQVWFQFP